MATILHILVTLTKYLCAFTWGIPYMYARCEVSMKQTCGLEDCPQTVTMMTTMTNDR